MNNTLTRALVVVVVIVVGGPCSIPAFAQEGDSMDPVPIIRAENINLNGTWNYQTTKPTVSGGCPAGTALAGTAEMTQDGNAVTLRYVTGAKCRPPAVCSYEGALDLAEDRSDLVVSNSVTVDDEGGEVSSAIRLVVHSNESATGSVTNHYVHPKGFECRWNMDVAFTRELDEGDD